MARTSKKTTAAAEEKAAPEEKISASRSGIMVIPGVKTQKITTLVIGTSVLVVNKFAQKAVEMMLQKHLGEASAGRELKDPVANFQGAAHRLSDGSYGIPAGGIKACIAEACDVKTGIAKSKAKALRVHPDDAATNLVRIVGPKPEDMGPSNHEFPYDGPAWPRLREDLVRNATGVADIRHRPEFWPWAMLLTVEFQQGLGSPKQILQAIAMAGFSVGFGEWRPKSKMSLSGSWGTFRLATEQEVEDYENDRLFSTGRVPHLMAAE